MMRIIRLRAEVIPMELGLGRTGIGILLAVFLMLTASDIVIWIRDGIVPGVEFFIGTLVVLIVVFLAVRGARAHPPPRKSR
jgi:hypothetical protein